MLILRELTSGIYFGAARRAPGRGPARAHGARGLGHGVYTSTRSSASAARRFRLAAGAAQEAHADRQVQRHAVRALLARGGGPDRARTSPTWRCDYLHVDNASMQLILNPRQFDVILTSNIFGDILSDEASVLPRLARHGALGFAQREGLRPLRADPRLGAGHRRPGQGESGRDDPQRRDDAAPLLRPAGSGAAPSRARSRRCWPKARARRTWRPPAAPS